MVIYHIIYLSIFFDRARSLYGDFTGGLERCIFFNPISSPHVAASSKFFWLAPHIASIFYMPDMFLHISESMKGEDAYDTYIET